LALQNKKKVNKKGIKTALRINKKSRQKQINLQQLIQEDSTCN
jgi:hypothetical protein